MRKPAKDNCNSKGNNGAKDESPRRFFSIFNAKNMDRQTVDLTGDPGQALILSKPKDTVTIQV